MKDYLSRLVGVGPQTAGRQAAALFALASLLAVLGAGLTPARTSALLAIAAADLLLASTAWWLPWPRWGRFSPCLLVLPAFTVLAFSTWAFGGFAAGTGPFFLLIYAWVGLNYPPWVIALMTPVALVAYAAPLVLTDQPPHVVSSALILLPTAVGIGLLISHQIRDQRRDRDRIAQIEQWRAALTATVAHDVRSPLTTVQLVLDALRDTDDTLTAAQREALVATGRRQIGRINLLSTGLLDAERVDSTGTLRLDLASVPVRRAVDESLELLNTDRVAVEVHPDLTVHADQPRLEQILVNLTANALRHGSPPVTIRCVSGDGQIRIEVRDHGPGVPQPQRERLFSRFGGMGTSADSVGLGLWIVRQLAQAHGGDVHYEEAEPGARLVVTLPTAGPGASDLVGGGFPPRRSKRRSV